MLQNEMREQIERLKVLPDLIAEKTKQNNSRDEINGLQGQLKDIFLGLVTIADALIDKETGKKLYPNATTREAFAKKETLADDLYISTEKKLNELIATKMRLDTEIGQLQNELSARKAVLYALTEMLHHESAKFSIITRKVEVCHVV